MNCVDNREALGAYADGQAGAAEALELEEHLERCAACRTRLASLRAMKASLAALPGAPLPAGLETALLGAVRAGAPRPRLVPRLAWTGGLSLAFAAAALVVFVREPAEEVLSLDAMLSAHAGYEASLRVDAEEDDEGALLEELDWLDGEAVDEL